MASMAGKKKVRTTCTRDCWDACGIIAHAENDRIVRLEGDRQHPFTRGFLCGKTYRFLDRFYSKERVLWPLLRLGEGWKPISWDEALDMASEKIVHLCDTYGSKSILSYQGNGHMGILRLLNRRFFNLLGGATAASGTLCDGAGDAGLVQSLGQNLLHDPLDLVNSRAILIWGRNPAVTNIHLVSILKETKARGARLVLIDPLRTPTASLVHSFIQPRAGTDGFLALGLAKVLLSQGLVGNKFIEDYTSGFSEYKKIVESVSLREVAEKCDLSEKEIESLAELYGTNKPAALVLGMGLQHYVQGAETFRLISALAALTGNIGRSGGGIHYSTSSSSHFDLSFLGDELDRSPRKVPKPLLAEYLSDLNDPPIKMAWIIAANPVNQSPESRRVQKALADLDFVVVIDQFLTDTADAADLFLPATTFLEREDITGSYGHNYIGPVNPVVEPQGQCKSELEIFQLLAERLGMRKELAGSPDFWLRKFVKPLVKVGLSYEHLRKEPVLDPNSPAVPFSDRIFATPSGHYEFISKLPSDQNVGSLPRDNDLNHWVHGHTYPLFFLAIKPLKYHLSQIMLGAQDGPLEVVVHPEVASKAGLADGEEGVLISPIDKLRVVVRYDEKQRRDVVKAEEGQWIKYGRGVNILVPALMSNYGECPSYYETRVRLEKVED